MVDKFEKRDKCLYCENAMDAKNRNKRFCSDKCRTYWNRENKGVVVNNLNEPTNQVKPVIQPTTNFVVDTTTAEKIADLEEKRKNLPPGQYFNKMYKLYTDQINNLKNNKQ